ncbi:MAG: trifunctional transcriptional activator/DNA repair protein Ada/methylated-DNA--[protein]-cysteine S-methyltransferase [Pseudomonadota bacterium]
MLFDLPSDDVLYAALLDRDADWDGRAFVGVTTTGVFCRLSCPARKPKRENCRFHDSVAACLEAGFRPCKRCKPLQHGMEPVVAELVAALSADPARRWREADLVQLGHDPSTVRRAFKRQLGITFLELARLRRVQEGFTALSQGEPVIEAQLTSSFESGSGFRAAMVRLLGLAPAAFRDDAPLKVAPIETPLGLMAAVADPHSLHLLEFMDRKALAGELKRLAQDTPGRLGFGRFASHDQIEAELQRYFAGEPVVFQTPLSLHGGPFARQVWAALRTIPAGETRSYGEIAAQIGRPSAVRAVARANGQNQIALVVPCHRVIGADGSLTGYGGGLHRKRALIALERQTAEMS